MAAECDLLGPFSFVIQAVLMALSLSSLLVKRQLENPKRSMSVWLMDSSKQALAAGSEHFINLFLAEIFGGQSEGDPCVWYFVAGFMGFAFGTPFAYIMVRLLTRLARKFHIAPLENTGVYNSDLLGDPKVSWWLAQCSTWLLIIALQRICIGLLFSVSYIHTALGHFGEFVMWPVEGTYYVRLFTVIMVFPTLINMAEFWVQDNFLMEQNRHARVRRFSIRRSQTLSQLGLSQKSFTNNNYSKLSN